MATDKHRQHRDKELEEFRAIMEVPEEFEDGFSFSSLLGTFFLALVMVPGAMYMELVAGLGLGNAAQWVTVLLFVEVAKRANAKLSRAQLFILFYMSGMMLGQRVFGMPLFRQFIVRSDAAVSSGISTMIPTWVAPANIGELGRSFLQKAWLPAILIIAFRLVVSQLNNVLLGYGLFRVTNDVEGLPFPLAPVGAQGILAVAEQVEGSARSAGTNVRWRMFCVGGGIGMIAGLIYMALPTLTGAFFDEPIMVFPIPFADFTTYTKDMLPAVATGMSFDMGHFMLGMILPYFAMLGSFIGLIITFVANPVLHSMGMMQTWEPGDGTVETLFANNVDFYFSFGIGVALAIAIYGIFTAIQTQRRKKKEGFGGKTDMDELKKKRGDIPTPFIILAYAGSVAAFVVVSGFLIDWHPGVMIVLVLFGLLYTPIISYVTARLEGLAGQVIEIPFIRELAFILSGYQGVAVWFLPIPRPNYGVVTVRYKQAELLGCKLSGIWKSTLILFPILMIAVIFFSSFIWSLAEVPSRVYPYTQEIWEFRAKNACLVYSSTLGEYSLFREALDGGRVLIGLGLGIFSITGMHLIGAPTMLVFGVVRGLNQTMPHAVIPNFIGACVGRFYFQRKYGREWRKMIPVVGAGFFVGMGLISVLAIGIVFLAKSVSTLPY